MELKKIIFDPALLDAPHPMAEMMYRLQTQKESSFSARELFRSQMPSAHGRRHYSYEVYQEGLLLPPDILRIDLSDYDGQAGGCIFITPASDAGSIRVFVSIRDEQGNLIESSRAIPIAPGAQEWGCAAMESVPPGTTVTVSVTAVDCVGGVRIENRRVTVP
jgi:hypothetical protein